MELDPRTTAVIAVHLQGDIVGPDGAFAGFFRQQVVERDVLAKNRVLLGAARDAGATVVYTRVAWQPDYSDLEVNSPLLGIVAEVAPLDGDQVVSHQRIGGFAGSGLHELLQSRGITTTVFSGTATNASVEGTARAASDLGYRVVVVEDACSAASPAAHQASVESLGLLAEITTVPELTAALAATESASR